MKEETLNNKQIEAINHIEGPLLVLAGAGSGKTRVVTHRIANLIKMGILPSDILAVTFTNKAAGEMKERVKKITNSYVLTCTFHSLGAKILRESIKPLGYSSDFNIYDEDDALKLIKNCLTSLSINDEKGLVRYIKSRISQAKNELLSPSEINIDINASQKEKSFLEVYPIYQSKLKEYNAVDFDDLLYLPIELFRKHRSVQEEYQRRWLFLLIDEYQDTNVAQYTLAKILSANHKNIFVVGDPDQSIYSWRGAKYQNILNFDKDFPDAKIINLEQNYRSTNTILSASNALIKKNTQRMEKRLWSDLGDGEKISIKICDTDKMEAIFIINELIKYQIKTQISLNDIVIFYRTNAQSRTFEDILLSKKIPYIIYGGLSFYQRKEIKDIIAFIKMIFSNSDFISFSRTINIPKRSIGPTTIAKLQSISENSQISILHACTSIIEHPENYPDIKISKKQIDSLLTYISLISQLRELAVKETALSEMITEIISLTNYLSHLKEDPESFDDRKENINELIAKAAEYEEINETPTLAKFLEEISLLSNVEKRDMDQSVKLMTIHNGKGLEFPLVFMAGMEEDVFPHINSKDSFDALEEERRLCYVGMTRAKKKLYLTAALYRYLFGTPKIMQPSRFLKEIPAEYLENLSEDISVKTYHKTEISIEPTETSSEFKTGDRIMHKTFGVGIIKKIYNTSMGETYDVLFNASHSTKTLVAKYAKLKKL